jgi:hypothetical protein
MHGRIAMTKILVRKIQSLTIAVPRSSAQNVWMRCCISGLLPGEKPREREPPLVLDSPTAPSMHKECRELAAVLITAPITGDWLPHDAQLAIEMTLTSFEASPNTRGICVQFASKLERAHVLINEAFRSG